MFLLTSIIAISIEEIAIIDVIIMLKTIINYFNVLVIVVLCSPDPSVNFSLKSPTDVYS